MRRKFGLLPQIIIAIILGIMLGGFVPQWFVKIFATFNGIFGNFLSFVIPFIIIGFIVPGIGHLGKGAGKMLGFSAVLAYVSTIMAGLLAFFVGSTLLPSLVAGNTLQTAENPEEFLQSAFFVVEMPPIMGVMSALIFSFIMGVGISVVKGDTLQKAFDEFQVIIEKLINVAIIPLLPFHIFGIFMNMTFGGQVQNILSVFAKVFVLVLALHILILVFQYTLAGTFTRKNPFRLLNTMLPAYFTAMGTQSSSATIPITLQAVKKTGIRGKIADFCIPLFATIHLSGSTITLVTCSLGVLLLNGGHPTMGSYLPFILMLGVTMVAAPGVPGGAVMAALGVLESMLGFDQTMLSLMIALYLAQDSFGTAANVTGDGALSIIVDKFMNRKKAEQVNVQEQVI